MPQLKPALSGDRSARAALKPWLQAVIAHLRLTLSRLWSKILRRGPTIAASGRSQKEKPLGLSMAGHREDFILMMVSGLTLDPTTKMPIVVLKDPDNKLNLPIWIGPLEAASMATELEGIRPARPMTHDLLRTVLSELGATVDSVEVTELRDNTYFAQIQMRTRDGR